MGKLWVEVCLISARELRRTLSLFKPQWFVVGWIDPDDKYCSRIDASGNTSPVWKTKFSACVDTSDSKFQDLALHVQVYSREPIFLRQSLQGTATVVLKELLDKYSDVSRPVEEEGSFQLQRKNSRKPQGFVDVSIRISKEREEKAASSSSLQSPDRIHLPATSFQQPGISNQALEIPPDYPAYHQPPRNPTPPPPPPPSNVGYISTFLPHAAGKGVGLGPVPGVGAGALAAGAIIFGDDFMSGFDFPSSLWDASVARSSTDPHNFVETL